MNYQEAWDFLDNLQFFKIKLGLESIRDFLERLGQPQQGLRFVHVAGTNGKGSVAATLLALFAGAGYRVGLYTSPHLNSVRERFRINGEFIPEEEFAVEASRIHEVLAGAQITYFEFTTALALLWFARRRVDLAIMEVGLGGRLDATNIICPLVSVITNVSMDHEAYLGHTLTEVALEKAGIIKKGVAVVSGVDGVESRQVVTERCLEEKAPLYLLGRDFQVTPGEERTWDYAGIAPASLSMTGLSCNLKGRHQQANAGLALAAAELLASQGFKLREEQIRQGLKQVNWPGRLEWRRVGLPQEIREKAALSGTDKGDSPRQYLFDGAHNPDGVRSLKEALQGDFVYDRLILIWGSMADKDMAATLPQLAPLCHTIILSQPTGERSATVQQLLATLPQELQARAILLPSVAEALARAHCLAQENDLICVAGSLYLVGAARQIMLGALAS